MQTTPLLDIAYVGPIPPHLGGISQHGACLIETLESLGHRVRVLSWRRQYPTLLYPGPQASIPRGSGGHFRLTWWNPVGWWRAGRGLRGVDLVVFPWVTPFHAPALRLIRRASRVPAVAVVHNAKPHERRPLDRTLTRLGLSGITGAVTLGSAVTEAIAGRFPGIPIVEAANPANLSARLPPRPLGESPFTLLIPGFVRPYKGVDLAIAAVAAARRLGRDVRLTIAGEFWNPTASEVADMVEAHGLGNAVSIRPGYLEDTELIEMIGSHHALLLPYRDATQSGLIPLAFEVGRPVIATDVGGLRGQVEPGTNALVSAPTSDEIASAIGAMIDSYPQLERGAAATSKATWEGVAAAVIAASGNA